MDGRVAVLLTNLFLQQLLFGCDRVHNERTATIEVTVEDLFTLRALCFVGTNWVIWLVTEFRYAEC